MTLGDLSALAKETGSRSLLRHESKVYESEIELFRRLQEKNDEVEALKRQIHDLNQKHAQDKQKLASIASQQIQLTEAQAGELIDQKSASIEELVLQLDGVLTDGKRIVTSLEEKLVTGVRYPTKFQPDDLCDPVFRAPENRPALPEACQNLTEHSYEKFEAIIRAASAPLPGDQHILQSIRESTSRAMELLAPTASPQTELRCIEIMRSVMRFALELREKVSWGDYVRPSLQHVEGMNLSVYNRVLNPDRGLDSTERSELELLAAQQDSMDDPLGVGAKVAQLREERAEEVGTYDKQLRELESVSRKAIQLYRSEVSAEIGQVRQVKEDKIAGCDEEEKVQRGQLAEMQDHLHKVLKDITGKLIDMNETQLNRAALVESLEKDEDAAAAVLKELDSEEAVLDKFESHVAIRKSAIQTMGVHECAILEHIEGLMAAGARSLFDGNKPLLMRQFEVLPDVYCQCALLEDLY
eukprot:TRINITY_DN18721_c0_g1_i8.p1 TRINITY_DN18721_c0_g1~~TRINITY_DN18721_c0_g1_i8.p1  ORF type:complete len:470 (+),score=132.32 TRINITY_DN18721_c0_g1_i8:146-1555(+)